MSRLIVAVRHVSIVEMPGRGWLIKEWGVYKRSAVEAQRAVLKDLRGGVAVVFEWEPRTLGGRLAVDALGREPAKSR